jgi:abequosyltransferase
MQDSEIILSICIPTFNREEYLKLCLTQFCKQADALGCQFEIIIGDNASFDHTSSVVYDFIHAGFPIKYYKHDENIGADANVLFCIKQAKGDYIWIIGDDDFVIDEMLLPVFNLLQAQSFRHLYLGNFWYDSDYRKEKPNGDDHFIPVAFSDKKAYLRKINIWTTFLSAHIFKRDVLAILDLSQFVGSNLNQLQWVLTSIFKEGVCVYVKGNILACKGNNTGGYSLFQTFGPNLNNILNELIRKRLVPAYTPDILNYYIIKDFMPIYCIRYKQKKLKGFESEKSPFHILHGIYKKYLIYWFVLKPIDWLPVFIGKKYYFGLKMLKII